MSEDFWTEIEELFFQGLRASDATRQRLLDGVHDARLVAAITQLWADAEAAGDFLRDRPSSDAAHAYRVGDAVGERFTLDRFLGAGGMGQVFGATDKRLDRTVALKFLNPRLARHPVMRGLLEREARAVCRLAEHPNICTVYDVLWHGDTPFLVMELLGGETLAARLIRGPLLVEDAVVIGLSIVEGLTHAHARDVIHRDLKPGNVMLTPFGPKLFDFGIAKRTEPARRDDVSILAPPGAFVGSASYTSPEQAEGIAIDLRSDVFSAGCVLYEMVTGVKAFEGASPLSILSAVLRAEPRPIRVINPSVPLEYTRIVARCLEKEPTRRFQRTTDLRDAMDRLARHGFAVPADVPVAYSSRAEPPRPPTSDTERDADGGEQDTVATGAARYANPLERGMLARGSTHPVSVMLSVTYGFMVGLALLVEVAYEWPAFQSWALPVSVISGASATGVSLVAWAVLRHRVANRRPRAVLPTLAIFAGWAIVLALAIAPRLPDRPLVRATIQTMTANVGYPKSLLEALALPVLAMVPLQVVCMLEAELRRGRAENVYRILSADHQVLPMSGILVIRPQSASIVFGAVTIWWMGANARLLESLQSGPHYGLFLELGVMRVASGLLMLFAVLAWYIWTLNDLRQYAQTLVQPKHASGG